MTRPTRIQFEEYPHAKTSIEIKATEMDVFKRALALLADAYEALASARSESWDILSGPTREEISAVMDAIQEFGA